MRTVLIRAVAILGMLVTTLAATPQSLSAATVVVCPSDVAMLTTAIAGAGSGGTVRFSCDASLMLSENIVLDSVTLDGNGYDVVLDGNHATRVLYINSGADVHLIGLRIINGASETLGSGILAEDSNTTLTIFESSLDSNRAPSEAINSFGGAIYSTGTVNIRRSTITNNYASRAGAIYARGKTTISESTISKNAGAYTGAVFSADTIAIVNSTISGNIATVQGGAVTIYGPNSQIINSTIAANSGYTISGGVRVDSGGSVSVTNTILAQAAGSNCDVGTGSTYINGGGNLSTDSTCTGATQVSFGDLMLGLLADAGGPTQTHPLLEGSVAIGAGILSVCVGTDVKGIDQRGYVRSTTACDVGAYDTTGTPDLTAPSIQATFDPSVPDGDNGWFTSDVTLTWNVADNESPGTVVKHGCVDQNITSDQEKTTFTCLASSIGGMSGSISLTIGRDATPPQVTVVGVEDGATYTLGAVPPASCVTADATSGVATNAILSSTGGPRGSVTVTCSGAKDFAGNVGSTSVTYSVTDGTPPVVDYALNPATPNGANGWYTGAVSLDWTVTENDSPETLQLTGCVDQTIASDQAKTTYSCAATSEGGMSGPVDVVIGRDGTAPVVSVIGVTDGATYTLGNVPSAGCTTTDATSGVATAATLTTTGGPVGEIIATCAGAVDYAGNASSASATYTVEYDWQGFATTTDDRRGPRKILAGLPVTVIFFINGNVGLDAVESITTIACNAAPGTQPVPAMPAGSRGQLQQGAGSSYVFWWQTTRWMAGTCQELRVTLADGTIWSQTYQFQR